MYEYINELMNESFYINRYLGPLVINYKYV